MNVLSLTFKDDPYLETSRVLYICPDNLMSVLIGSGNDDIIKKAQLYVIKTGF